MVTYTKEIVLEAAPYKTVKFRVEGAKTKEEADNELCRWVLDYPELVDLNQKVLRDCIKGWA